MNEHHEQLTASENDNLPANNTLRRFLVETGEYLILAVIITLLINFVTARVRVENVSMLPTLHQGQLVLVNKLAYITRPPKTGEIIIFHAPPEPGEDFIKRVIGAPGDTVLVQDGNVFVNDVLLEENYISSQPVYNGLWKVPTDSVFVLGDNRNDSADSHTWGFLSLDEVIGRVLLVYWPVNEMTLLSHPDSVTAAP